MAPITRRKRKVETEVLVDQDLSKVYPHCVIPPFQIHDPAGRLLRPRPILKVESWDGRDILSVVSKNPDK